MENRILEISLLNNKQQFSISSLVWEDPAAWGIVLVDLAKFLAETCSKQIKGACLFDSSLEVRLGRQAVETFDSPALVSASLPKA